MAGKNDQFDWVAFNRGRQMLPPRLQELARSLKPIQKRGKTRDELPSVLDANPIDNGTESRAPPEHDAQSSNEGNITTVGDTVVGLNHNDYQKNYWLLGAAALGLLYLYGKRQ